MIDLQYIVEFFRGVLTGVSVGMLFVLVVEVRKIKTILEELQNDKNRN